MTPEDIRQVKDILKTVPIKKTGDTPLEAFDLVPKKYVDTGIRNYGMMYIFTLGSGTNTVSISTKDQWTVASGATFGTGPSGTMTFSNGYQMFCGQAGTYFVSWTATMECATQNQDLEATFIVNGFVQPYGYGHAFAAGTSQAVNLSGNGIKYLAGGDYVAFAVLNHSSTATVVLDQVNLSAIRVG